MNEIKTILVPESHSTTCLGAAWEYSKNKTPVVITHLDIHVYSYFPAFYSI